MEKKRGRHLYLVIRWLVWLFSPKYRTVGEENIPQGACVIVGNHCHMYGPIAGELYIPGDHAVWCAGEMMDRKEAAAYAYQDFWSAKPKALRWFYRILSRLIAPLAEIIFTNAHTIGVYHDARVLSTFRESIEKLREGTRVVIFPEHYDRHNNIVYDFQDRFIDIARMYYGKTGEELQFVPLYVCPRLKTLSYGEPVTFRHGAPKEEERKRVCALLMDRITETAVHMPEHTVIPYPNVSKKHYPKNIPLEDYTSESKAV